MQTFTSDSHRGEYVTLFSTPAALPYNTFSALSSMEIPTSQWDTAYSVGTISCTRNEWVPL